MDEIILRLSAALEGRYRIEKELGAGGAATVYLAADLRHGRKVALKVLHPDLTAVVAGKRFLAEIRTTANLQHPHILPLFDSGEANGHLYYVMPYVEGETLRDRLEREGELPVEEALEIVTDLAEALNYAHQQGVVHRDIKPENVLFHGGRAVIADFGIALAVDAALGSRVTVTGQSVGTPYYMSPEQATPSGKVDGRSDVYSLACVLHEMLVGEPVFAGGTPRVVLAKHLSVPPIPVRKIRSRVPQGVETAILRALEKTPADRFSTMRDFAEALERSASSTPSPRMVWAATSGWLRSHPLSATAAVLVLGGTAFVVAPFLGGPAWTDRPSSIAVLPFRESASTEEEAGLAIRLADVISRELQRWDGLSVATDVDLAGPRRDMGLDQPILERSGDGAALARAADAQAMLALTVRQQGDSVSLQASLFDSRTGRRVGEPILTGGLAADLRSARLLAPVIGEVLGFADAPTPSRAIGAGTRSPEAAEAYLWGREALERNRLDEAEERFARAVELDSTFASALSFRAHPDFWRGAAVDYWVPRASSISRWSTAATRYVGGLSELNDLHVRAFYDLQNGDYASARDGYSAILDSDPTDAYARIMLGEIELIDRWSVRDAEGSLVPRSNLNRAWQAFSGAVRMEPTFELGYGQILAVQDWLETGLRGTCTGFMEVQSELRPIWQRRVPTPGMYPRCPAALDSIEWTSPDAIRSADQAVLRAGAERLFDQALGELTRWASFAPDQPRPLELLAESYLLRRNQLELTTPERHQSLAAEALRYRTQALALKSDTTATDLVTLASLQLAAGARGLAVENARKALAVYSASSAGGGIAAPSELMNVLVATGQASEALRVADALPSNGGYLAARYVTDPRTGENVALAAGAPIIEKLRVLAATGVSGPPLRAELRRLNEAWAAEDYPVEWQQLLRDRSTLDIAASLAFDSTALAQWASTVSEDDPAWLALSLSQVNPSRAANELDRSRASARSRTSVTVSFILAVAAGRLGRHSDAVALYSRLDSIPVETDVFNQAWGLQVLSQLLRAQEYEALGDDSTAIEYYRRFVEARSWPDSLTSPLLQSAKENLTRIDSRR